MLRLRLGPWLGQFPTLHRNITSQNGHACAVSWWAACSWTSAWRLCKVVGALVSSICFPTPYGICFIFSLVSTSSLPAITMQKNRMRYGGRSLSEQLSSMSSAVGSHGRISDSLNAYMIFRRLWRATSWYLSALPRLYASARALDTVIFELYTIQNAVVSALPWSTFMK